MIQTVKLARLRLSPSNVRKTGALLLEQLAADIAARGVLQNLLVTPVARARGTFDVFAGGRRLRALNLLAEQGAIDPAEYDVPVRILKGDDASLSEISTAENFQRLDMTPADECRAFQHFLGPDGDIDAVAKRFGVTRRFIEGRLRLAELAEPIFEALSEGAITLDLAKAYASTSSHEKQLLVWNSYGRNGYASADSIRRIIAQESLKSTDPVALLVGEEAYVAAGGAVDRELFSDTGDRWINPEIAERLAAERMEAEARRIGEETGLGWIRPIASNVTWNAAQDLHRVTLPTVPPTDEEVERMVAIDERLEAIASEMEDEETDEAASQALDEESDRLAAEREDLRRRPQLLPEELKPRVGAFLVLTQSGAMVLDPAYYSETPLRAGQDGAADGTGAEPDAGDDGTTLPGEAEATAPGGKPLSQTLRDQLALQRRDILSASLLAHPSLALDFALFVMIDARLNHSGRYGATVRAAAPSDPVLGSNVPASRARQYVAEAFDGLEASWTGPSTEVERFERFRVLEDDAKAAWLAYIVAISLEARSVGNGQLALQNRLASMMEVDVASWWRPTSENFFDRVSKGTLLALLEEVGGPALSGRHAQAKKPELSASCQKLFAGEAIVEAEIREAALAWVPDAMRFVDARTDHAAADEVSGAGETGEADNPTVVEGEADEVLEAAE
jgi:ParB family chromosome partitioning protein